MTMTRTISPARRALLGAALLPIAAVVAGAQLPNVSATAYGMGGNYTAAAHGFDAVAWNPAMLATPGNPMFSLAIASLNATGGLDPIDGSTLKPFAGKTLTDQTKSEWLQRITAAGGEKGSGDLAVTPIALSVGPVAFQVAEHMYMSGTIAPDIAELILFGNAGRTGSTRTMNFKGTDFAAASYTTAGMSFGFHVPRVKNLSMGFTGKYIIGTGKLEGRDVGSQLTGDTINVKVPLVFSNVMNMADNIYSDSGRHKSSQSGDWNAGTGIGVDMGFAYTMGKLTLGGTLANIVNTFKWDTTKFRAASGTAMITSDTNDTKHFTDSIPFAHAPQSLREDVINDQFKPEIAVGAAYELTSFMTVTGDVRQRVSNSGAKLGDRSQIGAGLEFRGIPLLPLRIGLTQYSSGWGASAGVGLSVFGVEISVAGALRTANDQSRQTGVMVGTLSIH